MNFKIKASRDFLLLMSILLILHLTYAHIKSTPTNAVWVIYESHSFFMDIMPPITLFISMVFINKRKNWARWLYAAYAMPAILYYIIADIDYEIQFRIFNISKIILLLILLILFISTTFIFFNKKSYHFFLIDTKTTEKSKRPLSITLLSIFMISAAIYFFYTLTHEWYRHYNDFGYIANSYFSIITITISYILPIFYSIAFLFGKEWGRIIYTVRSIPVFITDILMFLPQHIIYEENIEIMRVVLTILAHILLTLIPLFILYSKKANYYFR